MNRLALNYLILAICVILSVGCSSVKTAQKQSAAVVVTPSVQKKQCVAHNSLMKIFVSEWLQGNSPPPDVTEVDKTGVTAYLGVAYYASLVGLFVAQAAH
jgi:hypothetical protein